MWLLPTRNRPKAVEACIAAMKATGEVPETAVMVDGPMYNIEWPANWHVYESFGHLEMQRALNALLEKHPNEPTYGILTDQSRPITPLWASKLEEAAGTGYIAMCNTTRQRFNPRTGLRRITTICVGGELVRALGWIWLDKVCHLYGDDAWEELGYALNCIKYVPDVVIQALLKREGEVELDANHNRRWKGQSYMATDQQAYEKWKAEEFDDLLVKLERFKC